MRNTILRMTSVAMSNSRNIHLTQLKMKNRFSNLKNIGLILTCAFALSSCAALQIQEDRQKLAQLEADYHAGNVKKTDYKREKKRLEHEIQENQDLINNPPPAMDDQPQDGDGGQVPMDDGGVIYDDAGGEVAVDAPYFVYANIYYYQDHGRYYYAEHGHRRYVSSLPAGGRRVSSHDVHPTRPGPGTHQPSAPQQPKPGRPNQTPAGPARQSNNRPQGGGNATPQPQVRPNPAPVKAQPNAPSKNGKTDKDQQH